jgi:hypothetical protein
MAHGDARMRKWRGKWRMEWVASTLHTTSEHGVSSITTADAYTSAASSRLNWRPRRFKWTRPFRRKTKSGFCECAITFQTQSTSVTHYCIREFGRLPAFIVLLPALCLCLVLLHRNSGLFMRTRTEMPSHHCIHTPKRSGCHMSLWWFFGPIFRSGHSPCQCSQTFLIFFTRISHALWATGFRFRFTLYDVMGKEESSCCHVGHPSCLLANLLGLRIYSSHGQQLWIIGIYDTHRYQLL